MSLGCDGNRFPQPRFFPPGMHASELYRQAAACQSSKNCLTRAACATVRPSGAGSIAIVKCHFTLLFWEKAGEYRRWAPR